MKDFLGQWYGNAPPAAVVLVLVSVSDRTISFTHLSYHSYTNTNFLCSGYMKSIVSCGKAIYHTSNNKLL